MGGINWGDMSSDESVENARSPVRRSITFVGQSKGLIHRKEQYQTPRRSIRFQFSDSDEDCTTNSERTKSDKEVEITEKRNNYIEMIQNVRQLRKQQDDDDFKKQKSQSKKEKQAQKSKELDDLSDLLNEFGVVNEELSLDHLVNLEKDSIISIDLNNERLHNKWAVTNHKVKKKKKKKKSKGGDIISNNGAGNSGESPSMVHVDVEAILMAKTKIKDKRTVEKVAATMAKEIKAKKNAAVKTVKKKKKTRDKYAHGAPTR